MMVLSDLTLSFELLIRKSTKKLTIINTTTHSNKLVTNTSQQVGHKQTQIDVETTLLEKKIMEIMMLGQE